jgi:hypothetical protein
MHEADRVAADGHFTVISSANKRSLRPLHTRIIKLPYFRLALEAN